MRDTERDDENKEKSNVYYNETTRDTKWTPWLIPVIVMANVAIFIVIMFLNNCPKNSTGTNGECFAKFLRRFSFQPLKENPLLGPSSSTLEKWGALVWKKVLVEKEGWRLVSCMWLHAGLIHLLANMLSLFIIGIPLEKQFGFLKVGLVYLISGYGGSIISALFIQNSASVGASGALFGVLGAMLSELLTNWTIYANKARALITLLFLVILNLALGLLPRVDNFAHIGGFITGFLLGFIILIRPQFGWEMSAINNTEYGVRSRPKYNACQYVLCFLALVFVVAGLAFGTVLLFKGENGNKHCKWCHYLSCIPSSHWTC